MSRTRMRECHNGKNSTYLFMTDWKNRSWMGIIPCSLNLKWKRAWNKIINKMHNCGLFTPSVSVAAWKKHIDFNFIHFIYTKLELLMLEAKDTILHLLKCGKVWSCLHSELPLATDMNFDIWIFALGHRGIVPMLILFTVGKSGLIKDILIWL